MSTDTTELAPQPAYALDGPEALEAFMENARQRLFDFVYAQHLIGPILHSMLDVNGEFKDTPEVAAIRADTLFTNQFNAARAALGELGTPSVPISNQRILDTITEGLAQSMHPETPLVQCLVAQGKAENIAPPKIHTLHTRPTRPVNELVEEPLASLTPPCTRSRPRS